MHNKLAAELISQRYNPNYTLSLMLKLAAKKRKTEPADRPLWAMFPSLNTDSDSKHSLGRVLAAVTTGVGLGALGSYAGGAAGEYLESKMAPSSNPTSTGAGKFTGSFIGFGTAMLMGFQLGSKLYDAFFGG